MSYQERGCHIERGYHIERGCLMRGGVPAWMHPSKAALGPSMLPSALAPGGYNERGMG